MKAITLLLIVVYIVKRKYIYCNEYTKDVNNSQEMWKRMFFDNFFCLNNLSLIVLQPLVNLTNKKFPFISSVNE